MPPAQFVFLQNQNRERLCFVTGRHEPDLELVLEDRIDPVFEKRKADQVIEHPPTF
jgi:hypothetical protein